jgi:hypothetical protein
MTTNGRPLGAAPGEHDNRWLTAVASPVVGASFFALWFWLLPQWLGFSVEMAGAARWRWLAAIPSVLGFAVALRCVWDFGWTGRDGTRHARPRRSAAAIGRGGFLSLCSQPYVPGFRNWVDRIVDCFWPC